jgi:putative flippase GtrA
VISRRLLYFLLVGGLAAAVNFSSRLVFSLVMPFLPAVCLAFVAGLATAFLCNRRFVFPEAGNSATSQLWRFLLVNLLALLQTVVISLALRHWLPLMGITPHLAEALAHAAGILAPVLISYLAHSRWTFGHKSAAP